MINSKIKYILPCLLLIANVAIAQKIESRSMGLDSTSIVPQSMTPTPVINYIQATTYTAPGTISNLGSCGPSANSILPSAPNSFLCASGLPSAVTTSGGNYYWSCTGNSSGPSNTASCQASERVVAACGTDNGQTLSSTPTNLCSVGTASAVSLSGSTYSWSCNSNYGPRACNATQRAQGCSASDVYGIYAIDWNNFWFFTAPEGAIGWVNLYSTSRNSTIAEYVCSGGVWNFVTNRTF